MDIVENLDAWGEAYESGWLADLEANGTPNYKIYQRAKNSAAPAGPGIDLSQSRLLFISSAGGYLRDSQEPFDADNLLGDYSIRRFAVDTPLEQIAYAHTHYDHTAVNTDPQVLLPLQHLRNMAAEGIIGDLYPDIINFHGYQPDVRRTVHETIPAIRETIRGEKIDGVLLAPA